MNKHILLFVLLIVSNLMIAQKPNILIIQVDDMGYDDLSINGNTVSHTPNLDAFSLESVRFDDFMVNAVCTPTRASLLTGRDAWRTGVSSMHAGKDFLNLDETTFANIFKNNGYATGMWGKWHTGKADGYWPWDRGFDEGYYAELYRYFPSEGWHNEYPKLTTHTGKWSAEVLVDYTVDFINRKKDEPFLAYLSFLTCHDDWKAPETYVDKYRQQGRTERFATLLGMLEFVDHEIGRLLQYLTDQGLDENTIVLFLSDNGPNLGDTNDQEWALRNNHGFLGSKSRFWQNGLKSPLYVRWKGTYQPADVARLVTVTDIFPTILDIAGIDLPAENKALDGRSVKDYLEGINLERGTGLEDKKGIFSLRFPIWDENEQHPVQPEDRENFDFELQRMTIIGEDYKFLKNPVNVDGSPSKQNGDVLINRNTHPLESTNVASGNPAIAAALENDLSSWFNEIKSNPGAFVAPVFQIGWEGKKSSEVLAFGPSKTIGVENQSHRLIGFSDVGDKVEYNLMVHQAGLYTISMQAGQSNLSGYTFKVTCGASTATKNLGGQLNQEIATLQLAEGEQTFSIELTAIDQSQSPNFGLLRTFDFNLIQAAGGVEGLVKLSKSDGDWKWHNIKDDIELGDMGFANVDGNVTADLSSDSEAISLYSSDSSLENKIKLGLNNGNWLPETAFCGSGSSNPIAQIIYKTNHDISGRFVVSANFDGVKKFMQYDVNFEASSQWETLRINLNESALYDASAENIRLLIVQFNPISSHSEINLKLKEISIGSEDLIDASLGIEKTGLLSMMAYPNPAYDHLYVRLPFEGSAVLYIHNLLGVEEKQIVLDQANRTNKISIEDLQQGVYVIGVSYGEGKPIAYNAKLIVK